MKTDFIPIDYSYFDWNEKNYIKIIGRNSSGKRICVIDGCDVYLWAILKKNIGEKKIKSLVKKIEKLKIKSKTKEIKIEKVEIHEKKFLDSPVKALKIYTENYRNLHEIADHLNFGEIKKRRGYDLGFVTHYIIEKKFFPLEWYEISGESLNKSEEFGSLDSVLDVDFCIKLESLKKIEKQETTVVFKPKVLCYDIETEDIKIGGGEILMISLVSDNLKKVISWKKTNNPPDYVEYVNSEAELIEKFSEYIKEISPDFLVGYFSDGFDLPYLKARAQKLKINLCCGLDNTQPKFSRGKELVGKITGIVHIDLLKFIKTAYSQYMKSETLSLNEVAKEFLGDEKKDFKIKHSSQLKKEDLIKYYEYNLHDSVLTYNLFEKFLPDLIEFSRVIKEPVFELSRAGLSKYVESYILHNLERFDEIPEKKPVHSDISERRNYGPVEGAFVLEPTPGIYENIAMFDFTSMHTSIIISMNLSKATLLEKKARDCYETPEINLDGKKTKFYFSKKPGFFPQLLNEIFEKRKKYKQEYKKNPDPITFARNNAFKVLSASVHGYIGFFGARYYSKETSASILSFVRKFNKDAIQRIKKQGHRVIYSDTDSIAFLIEKKSKEEIKKLLEKINSELPGIMELELDGFYKRGIWVTTRAGTTGAKKKYALIDHEGKLKIRGFETVRRDWCKLARDLQNKVIQSILEEGSYEKALEDVKKIIDKLKQRKIEIEELFIRTQLKKPISEYKSISPHVVAARKMKELEIPVSQGNLITYYISGNNEKKKLIRDRVKLPVEKGEYDVDYYLENQLIPAVQNIFSIFNIDIEKIIQKKRQTTLGEFK